MKVIRHVDQKIFKEEKIFGLKKKPSPGTTVRIPHLLGLFILSKGVSLAFEIFLRAPPSRNLKIHPKKSAPAAGYCNYMQNQS